MESVQEFNSRLALQ